MPLRVAVLAVVLSFASSASAVEPRPAPLTRGDIVAAIDGMVLEARDPAALRAVEPQASVLARSCLARWPRRGPVTLAHYAVQCFPSRG